MPAPGTSTVDCPANATAPTPRLLMIIVEDHLLYQLLLYLLYLLALARSLIHSRILIAPVLLILGFILQLFFLQLQ
jgi:hypothetical protein